MELKKITRISMFLSLAVVLGIVESFIPLNNIMPGLKIGLANVMVLIVLYLYSPKDAFILSFLRVFLVGILRTGLFNITFFLSLGGAFFSIISMILAKKFLNLSIIGVSIIGAVSHVIGQVLMGSFILNTNSFIYMLPILLLISLPSGIIVGKLASEGQSYLNELVD